MIAPGHGCVGSNDLAKAKAFYDALLGSAGVTPLFEHPSGGLAIAVDGAGNLYTGGFGVIIAVYPPGATSPSRTIPANFGIYGLTT